MGGHDFTAATWRKSSRSSGNNGNCVEVAHTPAVTGVRDSKNPDGPILTVPVAAFAAFTTRTVRRPGR